MKVLTIGSDLTPTAARLVLVRASSFTATTATTAPLLYAFSVASVRASTAFESSFIASVTAGDTNVWDVINGVIDRRMVMNFGSFSND